MNKTNKKFVSISNRSDSRQTTGMFAVTLSNKFLPLQILYLGKTSCCHTKFHFSSEFNVTQKSWPNADKAMKLMKDILTSSIKKVLGEFGLRPKIWSTSSLKMLLKDNGQNQLKS